MKYVAMAIAAFAIMTLCVAPTLAQDTAASTVDARAPGVTINNPTPPNWAPGLGAAIGAGVTIMGAGYGISAIAGRAVESMARQPEAAGNIQGAMIVSAALIEGVSFFSLIVCILILVLE